MSEEIGEQNNEFVRQAREAQKTIKNKDLNPRPLSWKQKLARMVGVGTLAAAGVGGAAHEINKVRNGPEWFGEPISDQTHLVDLMKVEDNMGDLQERTFRDDPKESSHELTPDELKEKGIDPSKPQKIIEVKGATYPSPDKEGSVEENGERYGVWGEIVVTDPETGEDKPTGVFISKNHYDTRPDTVSQNSSSE